MMIGRLSILCLLLFLIFVAATPLEPPPLIQPTEILLRKQLNATQFISDNIKAFENRSEYGVDLFPEPKDMRTYLKINRTLAQQLANRWIKQSLQLTDGQLFQNIRKSHPTSTTPRTVPSP